MFTSLAPPDVSTFGALKRNNQVIRHFPGIIDDVSIYDRALSAEEVQQLFLGAPDIPPDARLQLIIERLQDIVAANPDTPLADKVEDVIGKAAVALYELTKTPPDYQAAMGNIEGAVGDLEAAVNEGLDSLEGTELMYDLADIARQLAQDALDQADGGDPSVIAEADQALDDGDALWASGAFKDAVNYYKDALAKAESALP